MRLFAFCYRGLLREFIYLNKYEGRWTLLADQNKKATVTEEDSSNVGANVTDAQQFDYDDVPRAM